MTDLLSNCCSAPPLGEINENDMTGMCSDCKEGCVFEEEEEDFLETWLLDK